MTTPYDLRAVFMSSDALLESRGGSWNADPAEAIKHNCLGVDTSTTASYTRPEQIEAIIRTLQSRPTELRAAIKSLEVGVLVSCGLVLCLVCRWCVVGVSLVCRWGGGGGVCLAFVCVWLLCVA